MRIKNEAKEASREAIHEAIDVELFSDELNRETMDDRRTKAATTLFLLHEPQKDESTQ